MDNNEIRENLINLEKSGNDYSVEDSNINQNDLVSSPMVEVKTKNSKPFYIAIWVCIGLFVLVMLMALSIELSQINNSTNIFKSEGNNTRAVLTTVEGNDKVYTSAGIYKENIDSVVAIQTEIVTTNMFGQRVAGAAAGSGFIISEDGYILTNAHVVEGATSIKVKMENGEEYKAAVVGKETENDVAVLKLDTDKTFKAVTLGDSDKMVVGEDVVAIGNPLGELTFSMTKGVVSALDREIQVDVRTSINMFQVDCAVNKGNSGGPIFNMYGEVIGIVSAKFASETIEGLGFCIPINDVANIITDLIEYGEVKNKAYMGISVSNINDTMVNQYNMVKGAYISSIEKGSCAEKAGLKIGDIIVELEGKKIESTSELLSAKRGYKYGDTVSLKVWRSGDYIDLSITFDKYDEEVVSEIEGRNNQKIENNANVPSIDGGNSNIYNEDDMLNEFFRHYFYGR